MSSKIKVDTIENVAGSGNVSLGSGHNLVVPGNITGQGTAAITSNATVGGTLGVTGTTTIGNGTSGIAKINGGSSSSGQIIFMDGGTNRARIGVPTGTTTLSLSGSNTLTGDVVIDADGRVTMPTQPAFSARGTDANWRAVSGTGSTWAGIGGTTYSSTSGNYQQGTNFSTSGHYGSANVGSSFNDATAVFTVPVSGFYFFYIRFYLNRTNTNSPGIYLNPRINAAPTDGTSAGIQGSYHFERTTQGLNANNAYIPFGRQDVYKMSANDTFTYALNPEAAGFQIYGAYTEFKGYLIG